MSKTKPKNANKKPSVIRILRNRIIAGLFVVLPLFITFVVIKWLYETLFSVVLSPIAYFLRHAWSLEKEEPSWVLEMALSLSALGLVLGILFVAGMFFRSRLHQSVDWVLLNVPGVNTVYSSVRNVFNAISSSHTSHREFKRVVLVQFPHPGMKAPAFVTGESKDIKTGRMILCIYVPTTPVPTSGYMLMVDQDDVIDLNWDLEETLQAIVSGGITVPDTVTFSAKPKIEKLSSRDTLRE